jgi:biofilm PGA synthesis N-glycosyltransferase PgaC
VREVLLAIAEHPAYVIGMWFLAGFPIFVAMFAINASRQYLLDRSRQATDYDLPHLPDLARAREKWPLVSVVIPARNEASTVTQTVQAALELHWPELEVIVIDDGSIDTTATELEAFAAHPNFCVISHDTPRGKSLSLNDALEIARSEIVLILDADAKPATNVLDRMVPHFLHYPDVAAVTGNPRVANTNKLLAKLQAIEFTSTVSTLRRGQSAWGRVNTMSGIMTALRRDVVLRLGGFSPMQPTEDIELTWRMHEAGYRCIYEPAAQVGMEVPETLSQWWSQRTRWSSGLVRVLQVHGISTLRKWEWPLVPLLLEALAAILWCHVLVVATIFWAVALWYGIPNLGNTLIIGHWGTMTVGIALGQVFWGIRLDSRHDKSIVTLWPLAPLYPILYWWLGALAVVWTTIPTMLTPPSIARWSLTRRARHLAAAQ